MLLMRLAPIIAVPLIMFVLSYALPTLGNPIFLIIGAVVGYQLGRICVARSGTRHGT
jgi:hypothetical protein